MNDAGAGTTTGRLVWWVSGVVVLLLLGGLVAWFTIGEGTPSDKTDGTASDSPASTVTTSSAGQLVKYCKEKLESSPNAEVSVKNKSVTVNSKTVAFTFGLTHSSEKFVAGDVRFEIEFFKGDTNVTADLGEEFNKNWGNAYASILPNAERLVADEDYETPKGWAQDNIRLRVTVTKIGYWCVPKDKYVRNQ